jgi:hypothetical protein
MPEASPVEATVKVRDAPFPENAPKVVPVLARVLRMVDLLVPKLETELEFCMVNAAAFPSLRVPPEELAPPRVTPRRKLLTELTSRIPEFRTATPVEALALSKTLVPDSLRVVPEPVTSKTPGNARFVPTTVTVPPPWTVAVLPPPITEFEADPVKASVLPEATSITLDVALNVRRLVFVVLIV